MRASSVTVDDEGEGIPAELRRRVFTKFWKGGVRGGSGLGLYIVNGLTRAHGGTVDHRRRARRRRADLADLAGVRRRLLNRPPEPPPDPAPQPGRGSRCAAS